MPPKNNRSNFPVPRVELFRSVCGDLKMPRGDKKAYTDKQKRQAVHIKEGYEERGVSDEEADARAWATVNKVSGGGKQSGSGRKQPATKRKAN